ncbi:MAG: homoserine kinase [Candidatus Tectomicrobia bacterium]|nr:homoserine kinase [Candidatus Tectomicrobia bacterium]
MTTPRSPLRQVRVKVPATTANLGSGFDIFGLALQLYNTYTLTLTCEPEWSVSLPPGIDLPSDADNLVFHAVRQVFQRLGAVPPSLHLDQEIDIPLSRGLGSSASAIIGGLVAANRLTGSTLDHATLLAMATEIEGHPDNVTPALMGGMTLCYATSAQYCYLALPIPQNVQIVVAIPDFELNTSQARSVLPNQVSRSDVIFNGSRTALLVAALYQKRYDLLAEAMDDRLHQPYRAALVPGMTEAIAAGYAANALGVALSGSGPSLIALTQNETSAVAAALSGAFARHDIACETRILQPDTTGAEDVETRCE